MINTQLKTKFDLEFNFLHLKIELPKLLNIDARITYCTCICFYMDVV